MGLGGTAKKMQKLADTAETLYEQIKDLQQRVVNLEESVDESTARLDHLEVASEKQRVLLEAIAAEHDVDVERVLAEAAIDEAEPGGSESGGSEPEAADSGEPDGDGPGTANADEVVADSAADAANGAEDATTADEGPTVVDDQGRTVE